MSVVAADPARPRDWMRVRSDAPGATSGRESSAPARLGPLLAACGLAGGVGVTTVAYLVALAASRRGAGSVLVADTGGPSGGLAARAGVDVGRSLSELAAQLATGTPLAGGIYATGSSGLRVLAARPEFSAPVPEVSLRRLVDDAREAHAVTVIDCGTLTRDAEQIVASQATHVAWVLVATRHGVEQGRRVLEAAPPMAGKELIVARNDARRAKASLRQLRAIAAERRTPLVLMPDLSGLEAGPIGTCLNEAQVPLQAILGALAR